MFYIISEYDIISLQILIIINLANIFLLFFTIFINLNRNNNIRRVFHHQPILNDNVLGVYQIDFKDLYSEIYSDNFPYNEKCSICLEDFQFSSSNNVIKTTNCSHFFHENCLKRWLRIRATCPNCNINIVARYIES